MRGVHHACSRLVWLPSLGGYFGGQNLSVLFVYSNLGQALNNFLIKWFLYVCFFVFPDFFIKKGLRIWLPLSVTAVHCSLKLI